MGKAMLAALSLLLVAALPEGMVGNDRNFTEPEEIEERVAAIRENRNLPPDPASDEIWGQRISSGTHHFGHARTGITHKAEVFTADRFYLLANESRAEEGLGPLPRLTHLDEAAKFHSEVMADEDRLFHSYDIAGEVDNWCRVGENVGRDSSAEVIHGAFIDSELHRDNIMDDRWTGTGVGVVWRDGSIWVTVVFRVFCDVESFVLTK